MWYFPLRLSIGGYIIAKTRFVVCEAGKTGQPTLCNPTWGNRCRTCASLLHIHVAFDLRLRGLRPETNRNYPIFKHKLTPKCYNCLASKHHSIFQVKSTYRVLLVGDHCGYSKDLV